MDYFEKKSLYNRVSFALTNFEDPKGQGVTKNEAVNEMYDVLVEVQNRWDELCSGRNE